MGVAAAGFLRGKTVQAQDHWVVLVAGSNGYWNYRHQADVCHAFQILTAAGIPRSNIVTMFYDDVASDPSNPFPGQLFNKPSDGPGRDVYADCTPDYSGTDVTAQNFLNVLTGNASAMHGIGSGKVINSTANSLVFVNFVDHGGEGLIAFPTGPYLYADQLVNALNFMNKTNMYSQLVFYMEACQSGSMFSDLLPTNTGVYAVTAANPSESSWGDYCPPQDFVNGTELNTCLGDEFSTNWMENSDEVGGLNQTLQQQYQTVQSETTLSHVMQYGDLGFVSQLVGDFQGNGSVSGTFVPGFSELNVDVDAHIYAQPHQWNARSAKLQFFVHMYSKASTDEEKTQWVRILWKTWTKAMSMYELFQALSIEILGKHLDEVLDVRPDDINWGLYRELNDFIENVCGRYDESILDLVRVAAHLAKSREYVEAAKDIVSTYC